MIELLLFLVGLIWYEDYGEAYREAESRGRMLLVLFADGGDSLGSRFFREVLSDKDLEKDLENFVLLKLGRKSKVLTEGGEVVLLECDSFQEMCGKEGLAIVDFESRGREYYGKVVSVFPFFNGRIYTKDQVRVILNLPKGTLTQRTLIYAVRAHPERPRSTDGQFDSVLAKEAERHSEYQAAICLQGHHRVNERFRRIRVLTGARELSEVCAESWPGQGLLESAIECVRCWRLSFGHWEAVRSWWSRYGYDMKRGRNGVWYATGIFVK